MIRVLICEDQPRFRKLLLRVLAAEADLQVVGEAATARSSPTRKAA